MNKQIKYIGIAIFIIGLLLGNCTTPTDSAAGGGGSETQNPVVLSFNGDTIIGHTEPLAGVRLYRENLLIKPDQTEGIYLGVADSSGTFIFPDMDSGTYNFHSRIDKTEESAYISEVNHTGEREDTVRAEFYPEGRIHGRYFRVVDADTIPLENILIGILGSPFISFTDTNGYYSLSEVPVGVHTLASGADAPAVGMFPIKISTIHIGPDSLSVQVNVNTGG